MQISGSLSQIAHEQHGLVIALRPKVGGDGSQFVEKLLQRRASVFQQRRLDCRQPQFSFALVEDLRQSIRQNYKDVSCMTEDCRFGKTLVREYSDWGSSADSSLTALPVSW